MPALPGGGSWAHGVKGQSEVRLRPDQFSPSSSCDSRQACGLCGLGQITWPSCALHSVSRVTHSLNKSLVCARHYSGPEDLAVHNVE